MENFRRKDIWQTPWGFAENQIIILGLVFVGFLLNILTGNFDFYLVARPYNFIFGGSIMLFMLLSFFFKNNKFIKWFSSLEVSISLLVAIVFLSLIMGLTKQETPQKLLLENFNNQINNQKLDVFSRLGFRQMTSSWSFVILYLMILFSLGGLVARRLTSKKKMNIIFILLHSGLWVILFFAGLGYVDTERYIMYVNKGEVEWRVYGHDGEKKELPIAIKLNDFKIEEYIPKLAVINRKTGEVQPSSNPEYLQIDTTKQKKYLLNQFEIVVENYIHEAVRSSDTSYRHIPMLAATPATYVEISKKTEKQRSENYQEVNKTDDNIKSGWVSAGNAAQPASYLILDSNYALVMTPPEPKSFISDVEIYTQDEKHEKASLEVNKPVKIGDWMIYQHSYDNSLGKMSNYSAFELVYDPWLYYIYFGMIMLISGSFLLIILGRKII